MYHTVRWFIPHAKSAEVILFITEFCSKKSRKKIWKISQNLTSHDRRFSSPALSGLFFSFCLSRVSEISAIVVCATRVECELKKPGAAGGFRPSEVSARAQEAHCRVRSAVVLYSSARSVEVRPRLTSNISLFMGRGSVRNDICTFHL